MYSPKKSRQFIAAGLAICMTVCSAPTTLSAAAKKASKAKVSPSSVSMKVGETKKITIKKKAKKAKYTFASSSPAKLSVSKKGLMKAKKTGKATVTVKEVIASKKTSIAKIKVTIKKKAVAEKPSVTTASPLPLATATPAPIVTGTPAPIISSSPSPAPTVRPTRTPLVLDDISTPDDFDKRKSDVSYGTLSKITYHSETVGTDRQANIILPPDYDENGDTLYPVLYLFHGGNGDENDWLDGKPAEILGNLVDQGLTEQMIVVMPNCRARENDKKDPSDSLSHEHMDAWTNFLYDFRDDLLPYINQNYKVYTDRDHTAIAGLSMGGRTALYLGFSLPDKVSYIGAFSPAFGIFEYENWGLHEDGYFTEEEFTFPEEYMDNTTCLIMNGDSDGMVRDEPERYHNALVNNKVNHYYYSFPGGDHNMVAWKNGLYNFLKVVFK